MGEILGCPDCREQSFSWLIEQVQFGNIHELDSGKRDGEGMRMGQVLDTDLHTEGPYCTGCDEHKELDELVVVNNDE